MRRVDRDRAVRWVAAGALCVLMRAAGATLPPELQAARDAAAARVTQARDRELAGWYDAQRLPMTGQGAVQLWSSDAGTLVVGDEGLRLSVKQGAEFARPGVTTFAGPVGLRYMAKTPRGFPASDLSCQLEAADLRVQLVFGGYGNAATHINICKDGNIRPIKNSAAPLIEVDHWHTVELLIGKDRTVSYVDGQLVVDAPLPQAVTKETKFSLALYVAGTDGIFKDVTILRPRGVDGSLADGATPAPVGAATQPDAGALQKHIDVAAKYLGDGSFEARQAAAEVLWNLRPQSEGAIKKLAESSDPEVHARAAELLERMSTVAAEPKVTTIPPRLTRRGTPILP